VIADPEVAALIQRTRIDRGLPPTIEDPAILARVANLLGTIRAPANRADS